MLALMLWLVIPSANLAAIHTYAKQGYTGPPLPQYLVSFALMLVFILQA